MRIEINNNSKYYYKPLLKINNSGRLRVRRGNFCNKNEQRQDLASNAIQNSVSVNKF